MFVNKSIFLESLICRLKGWNLFHNYNNSPISLGNKLRMEEGKQIGELARKLYPQGILITENGQKAIQVTNKYLNNIACTCLFEAAFTCDKYTTRADILIRESDLWHLIEVKSSTNFSLKTKSEQETFINDMAYTLMVIDKAIPINKISIMTLSKDYRLGMGVEKLFVMSDVTEAVIARKLEFEGVKNQIGKLITSDVAPQSNWIFGCKGCEFFQTMCLGQGIKHSIFNLPRITEKKCNELFGMNSYEINSIPESYPLTSGQMTIRNATVMNEPYLSGNLLM